MLRSDWSRHNTKLFPCHLKSTLAQLLKENEEKLENIKNTRLKMVLERTGTKYQPSGEGGTRSPPATPAKSKMAAIL